MRQRSTHAHGSASPLRAWLGCAALFVLGCGEAPTSQGPAKPAESAKPAPRSPAAPTLEDQLRDANLALDFGWASLRVDGEQIVVGGIAPDQKSVEEFRVALRAAALVDPMRFEALVREEFKVRRDYTLSLRREGQILHASGSMPDLESRDRLQAQAQSLFRGLNLRAVSPVKGAPPPAFERTADIAVSALAMFEYGSAELDVDTLALAGAVESSKREALDALLRKVPDAYAVSAEGIVDAANVRACLDKARAALAAHPIEFKGAELRRGLHFEALTLALASCPAPIAIQMHSDNSGPLAQRRQRGAARAAAVEAALRSAGASSDQFRVVDLGANFPIGDNSTTAGRAKNNRLSADFLTIAAEVAP